MNILVIGNGFDLAHGLPTKYTDFLFFCNIVNSIIKKNKIDDMSAKDYSNWLDNEEKILLGSKNFNINLYILNFTHGKYNISESDKIAYGEIINYFMIFFEKENNQKIIKEIIYLIFNNFWIDYFLQCNMHGSENWIDFESEISNVIKSIDEDMQKNKQGIRSLDDEIDNFSNEYLKNKYNEYIGYNRSANKYLFGTDKAITYREIRNNLYNDLNRLTRLFEIYLTEYVEKIDIKDTLTNIENVSAIPYEEHGEKGTLYGKVLSFNYTNIYEKAYLDKYNINISDYVDYIHGKADIKNSIETNNMVLGIDEFLPEIRKNKDTEFIAFKKFYQRIHKETGCKYKEWAEKIKESGKETEKELREQFPTQIPIGKFRRKHNLYIFGHSLDVTDRDILRDLILNDNVKTTIFYLNKDIMGQQIANLVKVIGQDELIRRTGGKTKTIYFVQQKG